MGDTYMAVSGLPDPCENHAQCIARLSLDMLEMAKNVKMGPNPVVNWAIVDFNREFHVSFTASNHWNTFRRGSHRCYWQQSAKILSFWEHS